MKQKSKVSNPQHLIISLTAGTISSWHTYNIKYMFRWFLCEASTTRPMSENLLTGSIWSSPLKEWVCAIYLLRLTLDMYYLDMWLSCLYWNDVMQNVRCDTWSLPETKRLVTGMVVIGTPTMKGWLLRLSERAHTFAQSMSFYMTTHVFKNI